MKTSQLLWMALVAMAGVPMLAQRVDADSDSSESAKTTYAPAPAGFGDESASRSWEMAQVTGELQGKLDSKLAKVGDRVVLKTADKIQTSDGTQLPRGTLLVGHITQVQAHDSDRAIAQIAIAFDRAERKGGQSIPVHSLIRTVRPSASETGMSRLDSDDAMSPGIGGGRMGARSGGGVMGGSGLGNVDPLGSSGGVTPDTGRLGGAANGTVDRDGNPTLAGAGAGVGSAGPVPSVSSSGTGVGTREASEVQSAGHGDQPISGGAHSAAAARAVPHATGMPGIMLAGTNTSSGVLIDADRRDIEFGSGTRFVMGVTADK